MLQAHAMFQKYRIWLDYNSIVTVVVPQQLFVNKYVVLISTNKLPVIQYGCY